VRSLRVLQVADDLCHQLGIGRVTGPRAASAAFPEWLDVIGEDDPDALAGDVARLLDELRPVFEAASES
jgi:hypothetical protein